MSGPSSGLVALARSIAEVRLAGLPRADIARTAFDHAAAVAATVAEAGGDEVSIAAAYLHDWFELDLGDWPDLGSPEADRIARIVRAVSIEPPSALRKWQRRRAELIAAAAVSADAAVRLVFAAEVLDTTKDYLRLAATAGGPAALRRLRGGEGGAAWFAEAAAEALGGRIPAPLEAALAAAAGELVRVVEGRDR